MDAFEEIAGELTDWGFSSSSRALNKARDAFNRALDERADKRYDERIAKTRVVRCGCCKGHLWTHEQCMDKYDYPCPDCGGSGFRLEVQE